jgi:hypothetical protein
MNGRGLKEKSLIKPYFYAKLAAIEAWCHIIEVAL